MFGNLVWCWYGFRYLVLVFAKWLWYLAFYFWYLIPVVGLVSGVGFGTGMRYLVIGLKYLVCVLVSSLELVLGRW